MQRGRCRVWRALVAVVLLTMMAAPGAAASSGGWWDAVEPSRVDAVATDGQGVLWAVREDPQGVSHDIRGMRLPTGQPVDIAVGPADQGAYGIDIHGGVAVWTESAVAWEQRDIRGMDLATGHEFTVAATDADESWPRISGRWVIWQSIEPLERGRRQTLWARDISAMGAPVTLIEGIVEAGRSGRDLRPPVFSSHMVSGNRVAWIERPDPSQYPSRLVVHDLVTGERTVVADDATAVAIDGDTVVYTRRGGALVRVDLGTDTRTVTEIDEAIVSLPLQTDGRYVVWNGSTLWGGYDLERGEPVPIAGQNVALGGGILVWSNPLWDRWYDPEARVVTEITAVRAADLMDGRVRRAFPETGRALAFRFLDFWDRHGGIPLFGYPVSGVWTEEDGQTGEHVQVQYLERAQFEYHIALRGTPYEVQLGRVGYEEAYARGLLDTEAFRPLPADTGSDAHCEFMPATGHRLCGGFRAYWHANGLDLGDPGISFRESLALFGYPISEEYVDPETGLVTQWFERARFEWHPGAWPERFDVLQGRVGAEVVGRRLP